MRVDTIEELRIWNDKLYNTGLKSVGAEWFIERGIKSWPVDRDACASHIPAVWEEDVDKLIKDIRAQFGNQVGFTQIKEKFCALTIYFTAPQSIYDQVNDMIKATQDILREKGLMP